MENQSSTSRLFHISTRSVNPITCETILTENDIVRILTKYKSICNWAYILHNRDVYIEEDEMLNSNNKAGSKKPDHYHILINLIKNIDSKCVSNWFGLTENYIHKVTGGKKAIADMLLYFTHTEENQVRLGKSQYSISEIKSTWNVEEILKEHKEFSRKEWYRLPIDKQLLYRITYEGMNLRNAEELDKIVYMDNSQKYKKARLDYLCNRSILPKTRVNFFISGNGGVGKGKLARCLSIALSSGEFRSEDDIIFNVGSSNVSFEGYDGQDTIVWSDTRAQSILNVFKERGNLLSAIDPFPERVRQNIKFGSMCLSNSKSMIISPQSFFKFMEGLISTVITHEEKEDLNQSYRRFPIVIFPDDENEAIEMYISDWFFNSNGKTSYGNFKKYIAYKKIRINPKLLLDCPDFKERIENIKYVLSSVRSIYEEAVSLLKGMSELDKEEYDKIYQTKNYGEELPFSGVLSERRG